jgi:hypothetical protein
MAGATMIYDAGRRILLGQAVNPKELESGKEYIFSLKTQGINFALFDDATMNGIAQGLTRLPRGTEDQVLTIKGVQLHKPSGNIFVLGQVLGSPGFVNPWAVYAVVAQAFESAKIGVTLLGVYAVGMSAGRTQYV